MSNAARSHNAMLVPSSVAVITAASKTWRAKPSPVGLQSSYTFEGIVVPTQPPCAEAALTNPEAVQGNVALARVGGDHVSVLRQARHAQEAGALALIILGPTDMRAPLAQSADGAEICIPVVLLEDCSERNAPATGTRVAVEPGALPTALSQLGCPPRRDGFLAMTISLSLLTGHGSTRAAAAKYPFDPSSAKSIDEDADGPGTSGIPSGFFRTPTALDAATGAPCQPREWLGPDGQGAEGGLYPLWSTTLEDIGSVRMPSPCPLCSDCAPILPLGDNRWRPQVGGSGMRLYFSVLAGVSSAPLPWSSLTVSISALGRSSDVRWARTAIAVPLHAPRRGRAPRRVPLRRTAPVA